jgi:hypothetical protein
VTPLADALALKLTAAPRFSDSQFERHPQRSIDALESLAHKSQGGVSAVSSQGVVIPGMLDYLCPQQPGHRSRKGSIWALFFSGGRLLAADYYERPGSA